MISNWIYRLLAFQVVFKVLIQIQGEVPDQHEKKYNGYSSSNKKCLNFELTGQYD